MSEETVPPKSEPTEVLEPSPAWSSACDSLEMIRQELRTFAKARDWDQFHTPRNLALALVGEVGELCEIFQWKGEVTNGLTGWDEKDRVHLGEELSDVLM